jgi:hypothetical protein
MDRRTDAASLGRELGATPVRYGAGLAGRVRALGPVDAAHRQLESGTVHQRIILTLN